MLSRLEELSNGGSEERRGSVNTTEYLLTCLIEECAEVIQRATKAQRFGLMEIQPGQKMDNQQRLQEEISDLWGTLVMLRDHGIGLHPLRHLGEKKIAKVKEFMEYSRKEGCLQ